MSSISSLSGDAPDFEVTKTESTTRVRRHPHEESGRRRKRGRGKDHEFEDALAMDTFEPAAEDDTEPRSR